MSSGPSGGPTADPGSSLLVRLRNAVASEAPGVKVDVVGGKFVAKTGAPGFRTIARRPVKLVEGWRSPERTFAFVVRWEERMASKNKESR